MSCSRVPGVSELRWGRETKSSVLSQLSKDYRLYGLLNILWLIFKRKSNPLHVGRSPHSHLSRLKSWDDSATAPLRWDVSHFPTEPALYRTTNWMFMTLYVSCFNRISAQRDIVIISGAIQRSATKCTGDFLFCGWKSHSRTKPQWLHFATPMPSSEAWMMKKIYI